jgi:hypothetical protein
MTKAQAAVAAILPDAIAARFRADQLCVVKDSSPSLRVGPTIIITKYSKHTPPRLLYGIRVWPNGWATDLRVDSSVSKKFRPTEAKLRSILHI